MAHPHGAVSEVCDCGISSSNSLAYFMLKCKFLAKYIAAHASLKRYFIYYAISECKIIIH